MEPLLKEIIALLKEIKKELEDLKNLFAKYDQELLLQDEELRNG